MSENRNWKKRHECEGGDSCVRVCVYVREMRVQVKHCLTLILN